MLQGLFGLTGWAGPATRTGARGEGGPNCAREGLEKGAPSILSRATSLSSATFTEKAVTRAVNGSSHAMPEQFLKLSMAYSVGPGGAQRGVRLPVTTLARGAQRQRFDSPFKSVPGEEPEQKLSPVMHDVKGRILINFDCHYALCIFIRMKNLLNLSKGHARLSASMAEPSAVRKISESKLLWYILAWLVVIACTSVSVWRETPQRSSVPQQHSGSSPVSSLSVALASPALKLATKPASAAGSACMSLHSAPSL